MSNWTQQNMPDLTGKVIIVTGAASGMGAACAQRLVEVGANVYGLDINEVTAPVAKSVIVNIMDKDSISAAVVNACHEMSIAPHQVAKVSGIGCSSKTPTYFLGNSHGFNSVHGRMPSVTTGANTANRHLTYIGVSGDGDSLSIGVGQFVHAIRRNLNMCYILENNGVYGLTKGQFSASADIGSKPKKGLRLH